MDAGRYRAAGAAFNVARRGHPLNASHSQPSRVAVVFTTRACVRACVRELPREIMRAKPVKAGTGGGGGGGGVDGGWRRAEDTIARGKGSDICSHVITPDCSSSRIRP